jgi:DNA primase
MRTTRAKPPPSARSIRCSRRDWPSASPRSRTAKDPDDFIKQNGGDAFREIIDKAEGFFDWYLKRLCTTNDTRTDKGRVTVLREFGEALVKTRNAVLIDTHAQKAALRLGSVDSDPGGS